MSAPAASTASTSSPRRAKSADRIDGAIQGVCMSGLTSGETLQLLTVLLSRADDDIGRECRTRRLFVPIQCLEIIPNKLLVETRRARSDTVRIRRPEARRVGCQHLVDERELARLVHTKFELRIGNNDAAAQGMLGGEVVDGDRGIPYPCRQRRSD